MQLLIAALLATQAVAQPAPQAQEPPKKEAQAAAAEAKEDKAPTKPIFEPTEVKSTGSVTLGGRRIAYQAVAGTLVVHSKGWEDTDAAEAAADPDSGKDDDDKPKAEASMFYAAYFRTGAPTAWSANPPE